MVANMIERTIHAFRLLALVVLVRRPVLLWAVGRAPTLGLMRCTEGPRVPETGENPVFTAQRPKSVDSVSGSGGKRGPSSGPME